MKNAKTATRPMCRRNERPGVQERRRLDGGQKADGHPLAGVDRAHLEDQRAAFELHARLGARGKLVLVARRSSRSRAEPVPTRRDRPG